HYDRLVRLSLTRRRDLNGRFCIAHRLPSAIDDSGLHRDMCGPGRFIRHPGPHRDAGALLRSFFRGHENAPKSDVNAIGHHYPHMRLDPRSAVPTAVRLLGGVSSHRQNISSCEVQTRREIETKACVSVRLVSDLAAVKINRRVTIHPVKLNADAL